MKSSQPFFPVMVSVSNEFPNLARLLEGNHPSFFWQFNPQVPIQIWDDAAKELRQDYPDWVSIIEKNGWNAFLMHTLGEGQFGDQRYSLSPAKRAYYILKPFLPRFITRILRQAYQTSQVKEFLLRWPLEDRFARFYLSLRQKVELQYPKSKPQPLWPDSAQAAFVLTHDIESKNGQRFIRTLADLEEEMGFRSSFNFIPEKYRLDYNLISELRERGFEVALHGLKHDGMLYSAKSKFKKRADKINGYLKKLKAVGFRSPLMHRNPEWLQLLHLDYDLSFFDTDPFEPMPGGVMTVWPFFIGRFVELPYTLVQDYTLLKVIAENSPSIWLKKINALLQIQGMILLNAHPDYLLDTACFSIYKEFLASVKEIPNVWNALPHDIAAWWRSRNKIRPT